MSVTIDAIIEGITDPVIVQLTNRDFDTFADPAPFDASGKTITLELRGADGVLVDTTGKVVWLDSSISKAQFNRGASDLTAALSPYRARWFVTDSATHPYPSTSTPDSWKVVRAT